MVQFVHLPFCDIIQKENNVNFGNLFGCVQEQKVYQSSI